MGKGPREKKEQVSDKAEPSASPSLASILFHPCLNKALRLTALAAIYSPISWLSLTPVYGSVPSALYHNQGKMFASFLGFLARRHLARVLPSKIVEWLPVLAFWIPTFQFVLFKYSSVPGLPYGPILTELLTYCPLALLSLFAAGTLLDEIDMSGSKSIVAEHGLSIVTYLTFICAERMTRIILLKNIGSNFVLSRIGLQVGVAILYALTIPGAILWPAIPSVAFTMMYNIHNPLQRTTNLLNSTLQFHNFTLIDRQESITGYISVLDNTAAHYRVMRCDHSLLGGEWRFPPRSGRRPPRAQEPIYAIFVMLEAVRLVETDDGQPRRADSESTALNIGLGIGTAPGALIAHGINTTIVELDPVVYEFAKMYFGLPVNHMPVIGDAVHLVEDAMARNLSTRYDYIIHDVFTGGAEPVELFTQEFLSGLKFLLKEDGVIAINYAGDLSLPAASHVIATIFSIFPTCRIFREVPPEAPPPSRAAAAAAAPPAPEDFTNMVIFCKHPSSPSLLTFRQPVMADFLESGARQQYLFPRPELEIPRERFGLGDEVGRGQVLRRGQTGHLERWHQTSAAGHWRIMRGVLPAVVWENW